MVLFLIYSEVYKLFIQRTLTSFILIWSQKKAILPDFTATEMFAGIANFFSRNDVNKVCTTYLITENSPPPISKSFHGTYIMFSLVFLKVCRHTVPCCDDRNVFFYYRHIWFLWSFSFLSVFTSDSTYMVLFLANPEM